MFSYLFESSHSLLWLIPIQMGDVLFMCYCFPTTDLKSMVSAGLTTLGCPYSFGGIGEERPIHALCVGHGGGSLPLFLASKLPGKES